MMYKIKTRIENTFIINFFIFLLLIIQSDQTSPFLNFLN
jgi:hypothetical protein